MNEDMYIESMIDVMIENAIKIKGDVNAKRINKETNKSSMGSISNVNFLGNNTNS